MRTLHRTWSTGTNAQKRDTSAGSPDRWNEMGSRYRRSGWAGVLSTATGVVFSADDRGSFMAVAADTGRQLWQHEMTQNMRAAPLTYMIDDRQHVTIASYSLLTAFALPPSD